MIEQRWRSGRQRWAPVGPRFEPARHAVDRLDEGRARAFVEAHHYSRSYPAAVAAWGLWRAGELAGVAVLGVPASRKVLTGPFPGLEPYRESAELSRFVLVDEVETNGESWFLARALDDARARGWLGVVSFSDPLPRATGGGEIVMPGHIGTIYQASNAVYAGRGTARTLTLLPDGTVLNARAAQKVRAGERGSEYVERKLVALGARPMRAGDDRARWLAAALDEVRARRVRHPGNHRYLFRLRRGVRIDAEPGPYPKARAA